MFKVNKCLKFISLISLIAILSVINYAVAENIRTKKVQPLMEVFHSSDAQYLEANINSSGKILDKFMSKKELMNLLMEFKSEFNINGNLTNDNLTYNMNSRIKDNCYNIETIEEKNQIQLILYGRDDKNNIVTIILISYIDKYSGVEETDLVLDIIIDKKNESIIENYNKKVKDIFDRYNSDTEITSCIVGTFKGKLNREDMYKIISKSMHSINGTRVEGLIQPSIMSVSAFSPQIDGCIYTGDKKMNLNIAMRYNEYEDKTYIWVGTPIITLGY